MTSFFGEGINAHPSLRKPIKIPVVPAHQQFVKTRLEEGKAQIIQGPRAHRYFIKTRLCYGKASTIQAPRAHADVIKTRLG